MVKKSSTGLRALALTLALSLTGTPVFALPTGWQVVAGDVSFEEQGATLNVTSRSAQAIVNYQSFNIGAGESVNFLLPSSVASILNRVTGGQASSILGAIHSNGQVLLVNPAGIHLGSTARVNTGAFLASSLDISNADYLNGLFKFSRQGQTGGIVNEGTIRGNDYAALLGASVNNKGLIESKAIGLAVGDEVLLEFGNGLSAKITVTQALKQQVEALAEVLANSGSLNARSVQLIAKLEKTLFDTVVNQSGIIRATGVTEAAGRIELRGESADGRMLVKNSGTLDASGSEDAGNGGSISVAGDVVEQGGLLLANAEGAGDAGTIDVTSRDFTDLKAGSRTLANAD